MAQHLLPGSIFLLLLTGLFIVGNLIYIPIVEEPKREARFGDECRSYQKLAPRWITRAKPWDPGCS